MSQTTLARASKQDGTHPRPLMLRPDWTSLDGDWDFAFDDHDEGESAGWWRPGSTAFDQTIEVPFPPESALSGIGDHGFHLVVWYRKRFRADRTSGLRTAVHFGAVDQDARVWVDGLLVGGHEGGQTAFRLDITDALND